MHWGGGGDRDHDHDAVDPGAGVVGRGPAAFPTGVCAFQLPDHLPPADTGLARDLVKGPYVFDFLAMTEKAEERDLEQAMMDRLQ